MTLMKQHIQVHKVKSSKKKDKNEAPCKNPNIQMKKIEECGKCEYVMLKERADYG